MRRQNGPNYPVPSPVCKSLRTLIHAPAPCSDVPEGEPPEIVRVATDCGRWLAESRIPKLFINTEPGAILTGRQREFCRTWRKQTEVTVEGIHFVQEDSPDKIGEALAAFVRSLRNL